MSPRTLRRTTPSTAIMAWVVAHPGLDAYDARAIATELGLTLTAYELSDLSLFVCHLVRQHRPAPRVEVYLSNGEQRASCPRCYMPVATGDARCPDRTCGIALCGSEPARVAS